jgi:hypothetical protein
MFNPVGVFLVTPLPWVLILYIGMYRHELGRLARPMRKRLSSRDCLTTLVQLGLITSSREAHNLSAVRRFCVAILPAVALSLVWIVLPMKSFYVPLAFQLGSAVYIIGIARMRFLGPPPYPPHRYRLDTSMRSSRTDHIRGPGPRAATTGRMSRGGDS